MINIPETTECVTCNKICEAACANSGLVPISEVMERLCKVKGCTHKETEYTSDVDLHTDICGVPLENPFILSSSVVASSYEMCARAFDMGWAGAVFKTISVFPVFEASPRFAATHYGDRSTILFPVFDHDKCIGCGRCYLSCRDGGHDAIIFDNQSRRPKLDGKKCAGCHLCILVCPANAVSPAHRRISKKSE